MILCVDMHSGTNFVMIFDCSKWVRPDNVSPASALKWSIRDKMTIFSKTISNKLFKTNKIKVVKLLNFPIFYLNVINCLPFYNLCLVLESNMSFSHS